MAAEPKPDQIENPLFLKVLLNMKTAEMASIPAERWPKRLSLHLLSKLPSSKQKVVAEILRLRDAAGKPAPAPAADPAGELLRRLQPMLERWIGDSEAEIEEVEAVVRSWRELKPQFGPTARDAAGRAPTALDDEAERLFEQCLDRGSALALRLNSKRLELTQFVQGLVSAGKHHGDRPPPTLAPVLKASRALVSRLQQLASRYYQLRLNLVCMEMQHAGEAIARCNRRRKQLTLDVERVSEELRQARSWKARLSGKSGHDKIEALNDMIVTLQQEIQVCVFNVPREEMHGWLNAIVDAYLDPHCGSIARTQIQRALVLFIDLARYRRRTVVEKMIERATGAHRIQGEVDDSRLIAGCIDSHRIDIWQQLLVGGDVSERLAELRQQLLNDYIAATAQRQAVKT